MATTNAPPLSIIRALSGAPIPPIARVRLMDDGAFEDLVRAWMSVLRAKRGYVGIERFGGAGDMGRDVIGWTSANKCNGVWDNIQCKRYAKSLGPSDLWPEIGKVLWHVSQGDYILPRTMEFSCSGGIGTRAKHLLTNPPLLKAGLIAAWPKGVQGKLTEAGPVVLEGPLAELVQQTDFSIFGPLAVEDVIDDLRDTPYFVSTFGEPPPERPPVEAPPASLQPHEVKYIDALLSVYAERRGVTQIAITNLDEAPRDRRHFEMCRQQFYSAEALAEFARDITTDGTFAALQEDVYSGILPEYLSHHETGLARLAAALRTAATLPPAGNFLYIYASPMDKQGVCHQLANNGRLSWIEP